MNLARWWTVAAVAALVLVGSAVDLAQYVSLPWLQGRIAPLRDWAQGSPVLALAAFLLAYITVSAFSLLGGNLMTLAAGAIFGLGIGGAIAAVAPVSGACITFLLARHLLRQAVERRFGARLAPLNRGVAAEGAFYLFALRMVPAVPFFLVNVGMALTPMPWRTFLWVSLVGMLAGNLALANLGTRLASLDSLSGLLSTELLLSAAVLGVLPLAARRLVRYLRGRRGARPKRA